jgi:regulator of replication initiation timing
MIKPWADRLLDNAKGATVAMLEEIDELRAVLGDLPESQAEMLQEIKKLRAELDSEKLYSKQAMQAVDEIAAERDALRQAIEQAEKVVPVRPSSFDILAITAAYEQGVGKGHQSHGLGVEIENPYVPGSCFEAWSLGYAEGKQQAAPKVPYGIKGESL